MRFFLDLALHFHFSHHCHLQQFLRLVFKAFKQDAEPRVKACDKEIRLSGGLAGMGKTIPSYRMALEDEIGRWKSFRNALSDQEEKQAFDELMDMCRNLASAGSCACKPIIFEPMAISILLAQQKKIQQLENKLKELLFQKTGGQTHG